MTGAGVRVSWERRAEIMRVASDARLELSRAVNRIQAGEPLDNFSEVMTALSDVTAMIDSYDDATR